MQYYMIGQIFEVIPKQITDKTTGQVSREFAEVTIEQVVTDANGFRVKSVDKVNLDQSHYNELKSAIDKYIAIPMEYREWRDKKTREHMSSMIAVDGLYTIHDKNPMATATDKPKMQKSAA